MLAIGPTCGKSFSGIWEVPLSSEVKYLGVALDSMLNWKRKTEERMEKGLNTLYKSWALPTRVIRWIYLPIVRTVITYGCVVRWSASDKNFQLKI